MNILLTVNNLDKSFGGVHALDHVSVEIHEGEILGLIGPNGSGKSTFVNTITGFYRPDAGSVKLYRTGHVEDITGLKPPEIASKRIARTFQSSRPFMNLTVLNNVATAAMLREPNVAAAKEKAKELIDFCGLGKFRDTKAKSLPIEQRKRLDLCRALATDPKLLMLDEVMAGLNPKEMEAGLELIRKINSTGVTVLFIEHVVKAVMTLCNRVIVLNQGKLLAQGSPQEIVENEEVIEAYLGEGFRKRRAGSNA